MEKPHRTTSGVITNINHEQLFLSEGMTVINSKFMMIWFWFILIYTYKQKKGCIEQPFYFNLSTLFKHAHQIVRYSLRLPEFWTMV